MKGLVGLAGLTASLMVAAGAHAAVVTYTISGMGSGSLDGVAFTDAAFNIDLVGDTANLEGGDIFSPPQISPLASATVRIDGFTEATLTPPARFGINRAFNIFFFARNDGFGGGLDLLDFHVSEADENAFDFLAPYGPASGFDVFISQFNDVQTSGGSLTFQAARDLTFAAAPGPAVPEPAAWSLMILGFGAAAAVLRQRGRPVEA